MPAALTAAACFCTCFTVQFFAQFQHPGITSPAPAAARAPLAARPQAHWISPGSFWYESTQGDSQYFSLVDGVQRTQRPLFDHALVAAALRVTKLRLARLDVEGQSAIGMIFDDSRCFRIDLPSSAVTVLDVPPESFALRPVQGERPSRGGGPVDLLLHNRSEEPLTLYWIDTGGHRQSYGLLPPHATRAQHTFSGHAWLALAPDGSPRGAYVASDQASVAIFPPTRDPEPLPLPTAAHDNRSPDGRFRIGLSGHNLQLIETDRPAMQLTQDGSADDSYDEHVIWSPDSRIALASRTVPAQSHPVHIVESSPASQVEPRLITFNYLKAGDRIARTRPLVIQTMPPRVIAIDTTLMPDPWDLSHEHWSADGRTCYLVYNQRGHQLLRLLAIDAATGAVRTVIEERSQTFIDYSSKLSVHYLAGSGQVLWASERDGFNHLYLYNLADGSLAGQIAPQGTIIRSVETVDESSRSLLLRVSSAYLDQDPYHIHFARVNLDGSGFTLLTQGDGTHEIDWSPDHSMFLDWYSRVDLPPVLELHRSNGERLLEVWHQDFRAPDTLPVRFVAKGRDGTTDIWGIIHFPAHHDPAHKYPVVESIYAGPHDSHVPKSYHAAYPTQREFTDRGFIVVQIDGMGTNNRGKAFHDVCFKNLADAGFPDRIAWIKAAAARYPEFDLARIGIYGGSAGGQNAMRAVLDHGDFYQAAAADCGCHDNRMDKIWWNEAWMSYPVDESYARSSNVIDAHKLQGKLLLTVGELDQNVDPASTMQVVDALIKADKDFEMLVIPGAGHGAGESAYGRRRRLQFFERTFHPQQ